MSSRETAKGEHKHGWLARRLARSPRVERWLRRLVSYSGTLDIVAEGRNSALVHQMRWARGCVEGSELALFVETPAGTEPENFTTHFVQCQCVWWHWFLAQSRQAQIRTMLDVGCGDGCITEHFVRHGIQAVGVTNNRHEQAQCRRRGIETVEDEFHFLRIPDDRFDLVFSSHSLEHSLSPLAALLEWKRVVRPGGYLMILLPLAVEGDVRVAFADHYDPQTDQLDFAVTTGDKLTVEAWQVASFTYSAPMHVFVLTCEQLIWLFQLAGLRLLAANPYDPITGRMLSVEQAAGRLPRDRAEALNGLFFLQKP